MNQPMRLLLALLISMPLMACMPALSKEPLRLEVFTAGGSGYGVTSTIIYGEHEALLVDAQLTNSDARRLAERFEALGKRLTAIFITHPDADHFIGLAILRDKYPQAKIYMAPAGLAAFPKSAAKAISDYKKGTRAEEAPDAEPMPEALPAMRLSVDGWPVEIISEMQADFMDAPANSAVWIPSLKVLVAGDFAFNDVHLYLVDSTAFVRANWRAALQKLQALKPSTVVAGHKNIPAAPDTSAVLAENARYLEAFERLRSAYPDAKQFEDAMRKEFPDRGYPLFLSLSAKSSSVR